MQKKKKVQFFHKKRLDKLHKFKYLRNFFFNLIIFNKLAVRNCSKIKKLI